MSLYDSFGDPTDLDTSISYYQEALDCLTAEHHNYDTLRRHYWLAFQKRGARDSRHLRTVSPNSTLSLSKLRLDDPDTQATDHENVSTTRP